VILVQKQFFLSHLLKTRFEKAGINIQRAGDGEEALELLKTIKPDLILLDIIIPKKSGFEVMEEIKASPSLKDIPIVIVSNLGQEADIVRGKDLGAIEYFIKAQTSIDVMIEKIKGLLRG